MPSKQENDINMVTIAIEACIRRSALIVFGSLPCYFYPIALGTDKNGNPIVCAIFYRTVIEGARRPQDTLPFDDMVSQKRYAPPHVYTVKSMYKTFKPTSRRKNFPSITLWKQNVETLREIHMNSKLKISKNALFVKNLDTIYTDLT